MSAAKRICINGMLVSVAMVLSYIEAVFPLSLLVPLPGVKLGLANIAIMICFYCLSPFDALIVGFLRILLTQILFGTVTGFWFSVGGFIFSFIGMLILKSAFFGGKVSFYGVGVLCAAFHNCGQIAAAILVFGNIGIAAYLPLLLIAAVITGFISGLCAVPISGLKVFKKKKNA